MRYYEQRKQNGPAAKLRLEEPDEELPRIVGWAGLYGSFADFGEYRERIRRGAFGRALAKDPDVRALVNHDPNLVLGRTRAGTLKLSESERGLRAEIQPGNTRAAEDVIEWLRRGDVSGMSFGFRVLKDDWCNEVIDDRMTVIRELIDFVLFDVSVVTFPAYRDTEVELVPSQPRKRNLPSDDYNLDMMRRRLDLLPNLDMMRRRLDLIDRS
jgi:HK97 family phage prohead protease